MIVTRRAADRGIVDHGWLIARHTFSFASYRDPRWDQFRALRVINEDTIAPGQGFGSHPHRDMEIITWVLEGALEHEDSTGTHGILRPGDAQVMSAGTGIVHSEVNASRDEPVHLLQTWILPARGGQQPSYRQQNFPMTARANQLCALASGDGQGDSLPIHQDAVVYVSNLESGRELIHPLGTGRGAWIQIARGALALGDELLVAGDGAGATEEATLTLRAEADAEFLLFDLP